MDHVKAFIDINISGKDNFHHANANHIVTKIGHQSVTEVARIFIKKLTNNKFQSYLDEINFCYDFL